MLAWNHDKLLSLLKIKADINFNLKSDILPYLFFFLWRKIEDLWRIIMVNSHSFREAILIMMMTRLATMWRFAPLPNSVAGCCGCWSGEYLTTDHWEHVVLQLNYDYKLYLDLETVINIIVIVIIVDINDTSEQK